MVPKKEDGQERAPFFGTTFWSVKIVQIPLKTGDFRGKNLTIFQFTKFGPIFPPKMIDGFQGDHLDNFDRVEKVVPKKDGQFALLHWLFLILDFVSV